LWIARAYAPTSESAFSIELVIKWSQRKVTLSAVDNLVCELDTMFVYIQLLWSIAILQCYVDICFKYLNFHMNYIYICRKKNASHRATHGHLTSHYRSTWKPPGLCSEEHVLRQQDGHTMQLSELKENPYINREALVEHDAIHFSPPVLLVMKSRMVQG
jgi:hypothetical protein